jgi:predicted DNA-binding ribbon-helix-helix protein
LRRLVKRSLTLAGHSTSIALEPEFWAVLEAMAKSRGTPLASLLAALDEGRGDRPLASALRVAALGAASNAGRENVDITTQ